MNYTLHPGAEQDIADMLDFYTAQAGIPVAQRFLQEFERVAKLLVANPHLTNMLAVASDFIWIPD